MKTVYCIGLNVGSAEPALQLNQTMRALADAGIVHALQIGAGAWGDCGERMLQVSITRNRFFHASADSLAAHLAAVLHQECIAVTDSSGEGARRWRLVDRAGAVSDGGTFDAFPLLGGIS